MDEQIDLLLMIQLVIKFLPQIGIDALQAHLVAAVALQKYRIHGFQPGVLPRGVPQDARRQKLEVHGQAGGLKDLFLTTDVLDRKILEQNLADILKAYGRIDALLNAAGGNMPGATISPTGDIFDLKIDEFQKVLDLNLTGTILPTQVFLKPMVEQRAGAIVNFSSMAAFRPLTRVAGYAAAKAGITNFTAFMATEIAKKFGEGIRINAIAPGFFLTEQNRALLTNPDGTYTQRGQDVIRQTPFGRMGRAEELCGTIQYLISDAASFVTGTVAVVDGGFNAFAM